jgi:hypothetical protein
MARDHASQLRSDGSAWQISVEYDIKGLYEDNQLYERCKFTNDADEAVVNAENGDLMATQRIELDTSDESRIAETIMDTWARSTYHADKFQYENADLAGVGLVVDESSGVVYVVMSVC